MQRCIRKKNCYTIDTDSLETIHKASLELLDTLGVIVKHEKALDILEGGGCRIDRNQERVFIPEEVVNKALSTAPEKITLYARNPENNVVLDGSRMFVISGAAALKIVDLQGNKRDPNMQDLYNFIRLHDGLDSIDIICPMVYPEGIEPERAETIQSAMAMKYSTKHCQFWAQGAKGVQDHFNMAAAIYGNEREARHKPLFGECIDLITPLMQPPEVVDALIRCAQLNVPAYIETCAVMGGTSPITPAGAVLQSNANILCGLVLAQLVNPGCPCIYSTASGIMDMTTGNYSSAAPESVRVQILTTQLSHYYKLPCNAGSGLDAKIVDEQGAFERTFQNMACALGGVDIIHQAVGILEMMNTASYEQCVIDDEIFNAISRITEPFEITEETLGLEAIRRVNMSTRHYLEDEHTLKFMRPNYWKPYLLNRDSYPVWKSSGQTSYRQRAKERAEEILKTHFPSPVSKQAMQEIDRIAGIEPDMYKENSYE